MKYIDLVKFEPIESVIQLLDANKADEGRRLVASYVISDAMADRIADVIFPQLGFDPAVDHKGILVVGNYGTGKSHLMSVISSIAEDASVVSEVRNDKVRAAASSIGGKFEVLRIEISSRMSLRDILVQELEGFLARKGVSFKFPPEDKVTQNKTSLIEMMDAFEQKFPSQGMLVVVDEMLDYLRSRKDTELVHDLSFLREIGEIAKNTRFRFIGGVQEAIFDSARFASTADSLRRVKDRFQQVLIDRQDIGFVVAERLLRKDENQRDAIRKHIEPFAKFYGSMGDRLEQFVRLFPVHPDYLAIFERIEFAENRNALSTLSAAMRRMLNQEVPADGPGVITYDSFWTDVRTNPAFRAQTGVRDVVRIAETLQEKIETAFPKGKAMSRPTAHRIIDGLAIQRLTTPDIHVEMGPTSAELRDQLLLMNPMAADFPSDEPAQDLLTFIDATIGDIMKAVNGQFITRASGSDQVFLDVAKDVDYDAEIDKRGESLDNEDLDNAYYQAVAHLMERTDEATHLPGHKIWQYPLDWFERRVHRDGYLFSGSPNDRPTAYPARDFYLYFVQPYDPPKFKDEEKPDEVFLRLTSKDESLTTILRRFSSASALAALNSGNAKTVYMAKAEDALRGMRKWLRDQQTTAFNVTYRGKTRTLGEWAKGFSVRDRAGIKGDETVNFREYINVSAGFLLASHFAEVYPEYPTFGTIVTDANRRPLCTTAVKALVSPSRPKDAVMILDALKLLDGDKLDPRQSPYAQEITARVAAKGNGQVLNRGEIFEATSMAESFAPARFGLEPDLVAVILAALVHSGDVIVSVAGRKIDSSNIGDGAASLVDELAAFKHVEAPKDVNVAVLRELYELFGLSSGLAQAAAKGDDAAVRTLQDAIEKTITSTLTLATGLETSLSFWGAQVISPEQVQDGRARIEAVRKFAEAHSPYNSPAKLKNLRTTLADITARADDFARFRRTASLVGQIETITKDATYLQQTEIVLRDDDPWLEKARKARHEITAQLSDVLDPAVMTELRNRLGTLKKDYVTHYLSLHAKARLGMQESKTKGTLMSDLRLKTLEQLTRVPILPANELDTFRNTLADLKTCAGLVESELGARATCPHCSYTPKADQLPLTLPASSILATLDDKLDTLVKAWTQRLREELEDPITLAEGLQLVEAKVRDRINEFARGGDLPEPLDPDFVTGIRDALSDLAKVEITSTSLRAALTGGGSPVTVDDFRKRFEKLLANELKGKDETKVRFVIVEGTN
ncbi:AAA family ATPase [Rhizobium leguminosarum]|uniref:DUF6079 family protein n=1 Tax=Rhizobium leguminosarum TaxID=384 RepID=UPI001C94A6AC|nr:DUF6079 family protein [Rhizobium leguminosarum]MBY5903935.1 AAA family ATPase [Rhizobium leguminosarum]MBY5910968.1 AAA family ATPase [Rhizobium leguminosarum]